MEFIQGTNSDIQAVMKIINQAKAFLKECGIDQWQGGYPSIETIEKDIERNELYLLKDHGKIIATVTVSFAGEPAYQTLHGKWKSNHPYAVIHRLAVDNHYRGKNLTAILFKNIEELCYKQNIHSIKTDTDMDNNTMKHILEKNGFEYCGTIQFDNSDKIAFEKLL